MPLAAEEAARIEALKRDEAARLEALQRDQAAEETRLAEEAELKILLEAEKKAERDARYAARKMRKAERKGAVERYR